MEPSCEHGLENCCECQVVRCEVHGRSDCGACVQELEHARKLKKLRQLREEEKLLWGEIATSIAMGFALIMAEAAKNPSKPK